MWSPFGEPPPPALEPSMYLYHYTDKEGFQNIMQTHVVVGSGSLCNTKAGMFGNGVYLTAMPPFNSTKTIIQNNYGNPNICQSKKMVSKTEIVFQFSLQYLLGARPVQQYGRDVWLYPFAYIDLRHQPFIVYSRDIDDDKYSEMQLQSVEPIGQTLGPGAFVAPVHGPVAPPSEWNQPQLGNCQNQGYQGPCPVTQLPQSVSVGGTSPEAMAQPNSSPTQHKDEQATKRKFKLRKMKTVKQVEKGKNDGLLPTPVFSHGGHQQVSRLGMALRNDGLLPSPFYGDGLLPRPVFSGPQRPPSRIGFSYPAPWIRYPFS